MANKRYYPVQSYYTGNQDGKVNDNKKIERQLEETNTTLEGGASPMAAGGVGLPLLNNRENKGFMRNKADGVLNGIQDNPTRVPVNPMIPNVPPVSTYQEPKAPTFHFPGVADSLKSLNFSSANLTPQAKNNITAYYQAMMDLMGGRLTADKFYSTITPLLSEIEPFVLNEDDWEALRDATIRTQNYILHYMWDDMQTMSKAMDLGFKQYQDTINDWIDKANLYYNGEDFIPNGTVKNRHFSPEASESYLKQNIKYLEDHMCVTIGKVKPTYANYDNGIDNYPNKGVIWIEEL